MSQFTYDAWFQVLLAADIPTLENCNKTCSLFRKILEKNSAFWIQKSEKDNNGAHLPSEKWRLAAVRNDFGREVADDVSVEKTADFKFDYRKLVTSQKGFAPFKPYQIGYHLTADKNFQFYTFGKEITLQPNGTGCEKDENFQKCFAFSHKKSCVASKIDLKQLGIDEWVLDHVRPMIRIKQKVNRHYKHSSRCVVTAKLSATPSFATAIEIYLGLQFEEGDKTYARKENIWWSTENPCAWETWTLDINDYPSGMRYLHIYTYGRQIGRSPFRFFHGPKVGDVEIQVILPDVPVVRRIEENVYKQDSDYDSSDVEMNEVNEVDYEDDEPMLQLIEEW